MDAERCRLAAYPLYGPLFFHGKSFQYVDSYSRLTARRLSVLLRGTALASWFGTYEAQDLVLGDPGRRDALLHMLQAAVPHLRVIPTAVESVVINPARVPVRVEAVERFASADTFVFDIRAFDSAGLLAESWRGASFRSLGEMHNESLFEGFPELAAAYLERVARASLLEASIEVRLVSDGAADPERRKARLLSEFAVAAPVHARCDGKPVVIGDPGVNLSFGHCGGLTIAVKADCKIGCDVERVLENAFDGIGSSQQAELAESVIAANGEPPAVAAARAWTIGEVLLKQGRRFDEHCTLSHVSSGAVAFEMAYGRAITVSLPIFGESYMFAVGVTETGFRAVPDLRNTGAAEPERVLAV